MERSANRDRVTVSPEKRLPLPRPLPALSGSTLEFDGRNVTLRWSRSPRPPRCDCRKPGGVGGRQGVGDQRSLPETAPKASQELGLLLAFKPLGDDGKSQV